jgi:hypothetical protein
MLLLQEFETFLKAPDGDDRSVGDEGEVDPGVGHQVRLELVQVHIQGPFEPGNMEHIKESSFF